MLVAPYLCYMRQDAAFIAGEAISQRVVGALLARCFERVVTVDAHLHRTPDIASIFPGIQSDNLSAIPAIAETLRRGALDPATVVVGPDSESLPWVSDLAGRLGLRHTVATKTRHGDRAVAIEFSDPACIAGHPALIADDIVSSGGTIVTCARALSAAGSDGHRRGRDPRAVSGSGKSGDDFGGNPFDPVDTKRAAFHQCHRTR